MFLAGKFAEASEKYKLACFKIRGSVLRPLIWSQALEYNHASAIQIAGYFPGSRAPVEAYGHLCCWAQPGHAVTMFQTEGEGIAIPSIPGRVFLRQHGPNTVSDTPEMLLQLKMQIQVMRHSHSRVA